MGKCEHKNTHEVSTWNKIVTKCRDCKTILGTRYKKVGKNK